MTVNETIAIIKRRMGFRTGLDTEILSAMNEVKLDFEQDRTLPTPWFLFADISSAVTVIAEERVPTPTDYITIDDNFRMYYFVSTAPIDEQWVEIIKAPHNFAKYLQPGNAGPPIYYAISGTYFRFFPTPDAAYALRLSYFQRSPAYVAGGAERDWVQYELEFLLTGALKRLATDTRDSDLAVAATAEHKDARLRFIARHESRYHDGSSYEMGGDD